MPQSTKTPHRVARQGGDVFVSHAGWLDHLEECAKLWEQQGAQGEADRIRQRVIKAIRLGVKRCAVCRRANERKNENG